MVTEDVEGRKKSYKSQQHVIYISILLPITNRFQGIFLREKQNRNPKGRLNEKIVIR